MSVLLAIGGSVNEYPMPRRPNSRAVFPVGNFPIARIVVGSSRGRIVVDPFQKTGNPILHLLVTITGDLALQNMAWRPFNRVTIELQKFQTFELREIGGESRNFILGE